MANNKETKPKKTVIKSKKEKIIELKPNIIVEELEALLELAKENKIECFLFAAYSGGNEIITSTCETTVNDHQALVGYLQSLATIRMLNEVISLDDLE